jgi:microcystin-dependent protein
MAKITSVSQTQRIVVNPSGQSIGVVNAGPIGPTGPPGLPGLTMIPIGSIIDYVGDTAPANFLMLNGATVTNGQNVYPDLWAILPASMKSGANIILLDARGRSTIGAGAGVGLTVRTLATTGGAETHLLTGGESGTSVHNHTQNSHTHTQDSHNHTQNGHTHTQDAHNHPAENFTSGGFSTNHYHNATANTGDTGWLKRGAWNGAQWDASFVNNGTRSVTFHGEANTDWGTHDHTHTTTVDLAPLQAVNQSTTPTNVGTIAVNQSTTPTNIATTAVNASSAHNNMQPWLALNKIIRCQ